MVTERLYFAYGSNMSVQQMHARCPASTMQRPGRLNGYRFRINTRGVATVVREEGAAVHGILWTLTDRDEAALDRYEGVLRGLYEKLMLPISTSSQASALALVYIAAGSAPGIPRAGYLESILEAAQAQGLDQTYVEELRRWLPIAG
ncbi:MAG TPA: gamma-glutamylcyclotransferase family protein [Planctomycetota bacterium]|nr:gamma-glutamylcyclotransferase family protein [Planctomycetota bacterium]